MYCCAYSGCTLYNQTTIGDLEYDNDSLRLGALEPLRCFPATGDGDVAAGDGGDHVPRKSIITVVCSVAALLVLIGLTLVAVFRLRHTHRGTRGKEHQSKQRLSYCQEQQQAGAGSASLVCSTGALSGSAPIEGRFSKGPSAPRTLAVTSIGVRRSSTLSDVLQTPCRIGAPAVSAASNCRIAPASGASHETILTGFASATLVQPSTLAEPKDMDRLVTALENMATAEPPQLLAGRYRLRAEWARGGQALVVFARNAGDGFFQYAIKCVFVLPSICHSCEPARPRRAAANLSLFLRDVLRDAQVWWSSEPHLVATGTS